MRQILFWQPLQADLQESHYQNEDTEITLQILYASPDQSFHCKLRQGYIEFLQIRNTFKDDSNVDIYIYMYIYTVFIIINVLGVN